MAEQELIKIVCVSDNHGTMDPIKQLPSLFPDADYFLHCGDSREPVRRYGPYAQVRGNNDFYDVPDFRVLEIGSHRIFMTHGHYYQVKSTLEILDEEAESEGCSIALYGHTHRPAMDMGRTLMINPGSAQDGRIAFLEVNEGKPRIQLWSFS